MVLGWETSHASRAPTSGPARHQSRELDKNYAKRPTNVGDVEFTDSGDRAASAAAQHNGRL